MTDNMELDLVYVCFTIRHHGKYSGFDQIGDYLNSSIYLDREKFDNTSACVRRFLFDSFRPEGGSQIYSFVPK